jgi:uncharacterized protein (TIGR03067 family)
MNRVVLSHTTTLLACLIAAASLGEEPKIRRGTTVYIQKDAVKVTDGFEAEGMFLHRGSRVKVLQVEADRVRVELLGGVQGYWGWISPDALGERKPAVEKGDERELPPVRDGDDDADKIIGTWRSISHERDGIEIVYGEPGDSNRPLGEYWRFTKDGIVVWSGRGRDEKPTRYPGLRMDSKQSPKHLDIVNSDGRNTIYFNGVYAFDGDKLVWVTDESPRQIVDRRNMTINTVRPTGFRTQEGDGRKRLVLIRVKDKVSPPDEN